MADKELSIVHGPTEPELWSQTLSTLIDDQAARYGDKTAVIVPWQSARLSYQQLADRSKVLASSVLQMGLRKGDCVGIMAGNCYEYLEVFFGGARIGCPVVVLNNFYTPDELRNAVVQSSCRLMFMSSKIGQRDLSSHIEMLLSSGISELSRIVCLGETERTSQSAQVQSYHAFASTGNSILIDDSVLKRVEGDVAPSDVLNLQFTSGTTGSPKAAMLTHVNLINNARFVGDALRLQPDDVVCCPPPLFHCFGLVMGFLASFCHGSSIVFPSDFFDAKLVVNAIVDESATVLLGVPTMFVAEMEIMEKTGQRPVTLSKGLAAGSAVPIPLMNQLRDKMGVDKMLIAYGMTETSPVTFITSIDDSVERRSSTIGRVMPHCAAKIVDKQGVTVPRGIRGEICTSGFALQRGYWRNEAKTKEVMKADEKGVRWMCTGDEGYIDDEGYGHITGRIKDIIIRGGENIWPIEIEERLISHPVISEASVVGLADERYGEVVSCFLKSSDRSARLEDQEVRNWVSQKLGRHKAPKHVFWIGDPRIGNDFPKTGSGKYQKHILRAIGDRLISDKGVRARL